MTGLPARVHFALTAGFFVSALTFIGRDAFMWTLSLVLMFCHGWLFFERLDEHIEKEIERETK